MKSEIILKLIDVKIIKSIALKAGKAILKEYTCDMDIKYKDDLSPLTKADSISNDIICTELIKYYPHIPILSEENKQAPYEIRKDWEYYWCIDPMDGTKEFIKKNGEFTVNIALVHRGMPVIGVVYAPVLESMYYAKKGEGAFLNGEKLPLRANDNYLKSISVVASKSHMSDETKYFLDNLTLKTEHLTLSSKGSSLKLCMVATGEADIYPRIAPTMEWDTAAAHAIVLESGKNVYVYDEKIGSESYLANKDLVPLKYNKENLLNPSFVVA